MNENSPCPECRELGQSTQNALNSVRKESSAVEKRVLALEINAEHQKDSVSQLRADFMTMQGSFKIDIERLQNTLHTDIKMIQNTLNEIIRKQAIEEAKVSTGVTIGKLLVEKMPWLIAIGAVIAAAFDHFRDTGGTP